MIYTKTIIEAAGGSAGNPSLNRMPVTGGLIYRFELYFPPGSSGLLNVAVKDGGAALYPSEPGEWFFGDNTLIAFNDLYIVSSRPTVLNIWCYNLDTDFDHKFQVRIGQVLDPVIMQYYLPSLNQDNLVEQLAAIIESQNVGRDAARARAIELADQMEGET